MNDDETPEVKSLMPNSEFSKEVMQGTYPKDTIGYHWLMSFHLFGQESPATKFLANKAANYQRGFNEPVIASEEQVVMMLGALHNGSIKADERGELIPDTPADTTGGTRAAS